MLNDLTILLVTKNRYKFLKRWLDFANFSSLSCNIFIADGSSETEFQQNKIDQLKYPNLNLTYKKYPEDKTFENMYMKVVNALECIETKFAVWADDDDFYFEDGLSQSINFLNRNEDYSSCRTLTGSFDVNENTESKKNKLYGEIEYITFHNYPAYQNQISYENENIINRLEKFTTIKNFTWYDVHRTSHMKKIWTVIKECNFQNILLSECLLDFLNTIEGKMKRFSKINDKIYLLRQAPPKESCARNFRLLNGDTLDQFFHKSWNYEYSKFIETISRLLMKKQNFNQDVSVELTSKFFRNYYKNAVLQCFSVNKKRYNSINKYFNLFYYYFIKLKIIRQRFILKFFLKNDISKSKFKEYFTFINFFGQP